jgi:hypothetical protein
MKTSACVWTTDIGMQGQGGRYRENVPPLPVQYKNLGITVTAPPFLDRSAYGFFFSQFHFRFLDHVLGVMFNTKVAGVSGLRFIPEGTARPQQDQGN